MPRSSRASLVGLALAVVRDVYTTGEVAQVCRVAPRTATKWIDAGELPGYRIPMGTDRRVLHADLVKFLRDHGMPTWGLDAGGVVVAVGFTREDAAGLSGEFPADGPIAVHFAPGAFDAGRLAALAPGVVVVDLAIGRLDAAAIAASCRRLADYSQLTLIAVGSDAIPESLGFDVALVRPVSPAVLADAIRRAIGGGL